MLLIFLYTVLWTKGILQTNTNFIIQIIIIDQSRIFSTNAKQIFFGYLILLSYEILIRAFITYLMRLL
jgi:hypothetical protein